MVATAMRKVSCRLCILLLLPDSHVLIHLFKLNRVGHTASLRKPLAAAVTATSSGSTKLVAVSVAASSAVFNTVVVAGLS
jgi:hypothetical protein